MEPDNQFNRLALWVAVVVILATLGVLATLEPTDPDGIPIATCYGDGVGKVCR